jgi:V/A-type H+-transporting ATPase subunit D
MLLRRKREALVAELFERARPAVEARRAIDDQARLAYDALFEALSALGRERLIAIGWPERDVQVDLLPREAGGIHGVTYAKPPSLVRTPAARGLAPAPEEASAQVAAEQVERFVELVLRQAPDDIFMRRLAESLSRVSRLVNTLEQRVTTALDQELDSMRRTLDEREREEHLRLKRRVQASHR